MWDAFGRSNICDAPGMGPEIHGYIGFLDARDTVTLVVDIPVQLAKASRRFSLIVDKQSIPVKSVTELSGAMDADMVTLPGNFQRVLGESDWQPSGRATRMRLDAPGVYTLSVRLPAGTYHYKVARGGNWSDNIGRDFKQGGDNFELALKQSGLVRFVVDYNQKTVRNSFEHPQEVRSATKEDRWAPSSVAETRYLSLTLSAPVSRGVASRAVTLVDSERKRHYPIYARGILDEPEYAPTMMDLSPKVSRTRIVLRTWSPVSHAVEVELRTPTGATDLPMHYVGYGVWEFTSLSDFHMRGYRFKYHRQDKIVSAVDIYSVGATNDGKWSIAVDLTRTNPTGWETDRAVQMPQQTDAILYEAHIRDLTSHVASGVPETLRGKYSGLGLRGTRVPGSGEPTGIDHLVRLGITHLHLLPFQKFSRSTEGLYNWGYETSLFNVPEDTYAVHAGDTQRTILEVKELVKSLHRARIGLVMDVVYNHSVPATGDTSPFWAAVPYYWFRTDHEGIVVNESGVGNALNDERKMVRKFVCDSVAYWAREYHVDGFRFDLLGIFTKSTAMAVRKTVDAIRPGIILYGEPWTGAGPTRLAKGDQRNTGFAVFNDTFRGLFRGDLDGTGKGVLLGGTWDRARLELVLTGSPDFADTPSETVSYLSAHDNLTLRDKIDLCTGWGATSEKTDAIVRAAISITLLARGIPFIEGGIEIGRTKARNPNTYNAGDVTNQYAWHVFTPGDAQTVSHLAGLCALRKAHAVFRSNKRTPRLPGSKVLLDGLPPQVLAWELIAGGDDTWKKVRIMVNLSERMTSIVVDAAWQLGHSDGTIGIRNVGASSIRWEMDPGGTLVVFQE